MSAAHHYACVVYHVVAYAKDGAGWTEMLRGSRGEIVSHRRSTQPEAVGDAAYVGTCCVGCGAAADFGTQGQAVSDVAASKARKRSQSPAVGSNQNLKVRVASPDQKIEVRILQGGLQEVKSSWKG